MASSLSDLSNLFERIHRIQCKYTHNEFELSNLSEEDIKKILLTIDTSKAAGIYQIQAKFLKEQC